MFKNSFMGLEIIAGKFMRNGVEGKAEFGNLEQIEFLQKAAIREKDLTDGIEAETDVFDDTPDEDDRTWIAETAFVCVFGETKRISQLASHEDDYDGLIKLDIRCQCGRKYKTSASNIQDIIFIKLQ